MRKVKKPLKKQPKLHQQVTKYAQRLSERVFYDLVTALRGPDNQSNGLLVVKEVVTARLRWIAFGKLVPGTVVRGQLEAREVRAVFTAYRRRYSADAATSDYMSGSSTAHFTDHLRAAILATANHRIWGGRAMPLVYALSRYREVPGQEGVYLSVPIELQAVLDATKAVQ